MGQIVLLFYHNLGKRQVCICIPNSYARCQQRITLRKRGSYDEY